MRACIVGSGPSGFYTAKYLLKSLTSTRLSRLDIIERLPTPFGLVRYGVAPDHPEVKSVQNDFTKVMEEDPRVRFLGNVCVNRDVTVDALRNVYDVVVFAYGADGERKLGLHKEDQLKGVTGAREFVAWYNGHPDISSEMGAKFADYLAHAEDVVIVGNGNVAVDCARILLTEMDELRKTDIATRALEALSKSQVKRVTLLGRRGHVQASFTMKELRELTKMSTAKCVIDPKELDLGLNEASKAEINVHRAQKRMDALLRETAEAGQDQHERSVSLRFLLQPVELQGDVRVEAVKCERTVLQGPTGMQIAKGSGVFTTIPAQFVLRSVGYKGVCIDPKLPFDHRRGVIPTDVSGRVLESVTEKTPIHGLYATGWIRRGPTGIIGSNIADAREVVDAIVKDFEHAPVVTRKQDEQVMLNIAKPIVDWNGVLRLQAEEEKRGHASSPPKPREKIETVNEMLKYAAQQQQ